MDLLFVVILFGLIGRCLCKDLEIYMELILMNMVIYLFMMWMWNMIWVYFGIDLCVCFICCKEGIMGGDGLYGVGFYIIWIELICFN